jgi:hypothetical protein
MPRYQPWHDRELGYNHHNTRAARSRRGRRGRPVSKQHRTTPPAANSAPRRKRSDLDDLFQDLLSEDDKRRRYAVRMLSRHATSRQVADFLRELRNVQWQGKVEAVGVLAKLGDRVAVDRLKALVLDFNPRVRQAARKALKKLGIDRPFTDDDVVELVSYLEHPSWWVKTSAIKSLAALKDKRAVDPISQCLLDEDPTVCEAARHALEELKRDGK